MLKVIIRILILIYSLSGYLAYAEPDVNYFFHWSNENRHKMLFSVRNLRKSVAESVYGTGAQGKLSKYANAGRGLYVADTVFTRVNSEFRQ